MYIFSCFCCCCFFFWKMLGRSNMQNADVCCLRVGSKMNYFAPFWCHVIRRQRNVEKQQHEKKFRYLHLYLIFPSSDAQRSLFFPFIGVFLANLFCSRFLSLFVVILCPIALHIAPILSQCLSFFHSFN